MRWCGCSAVSIKGAGLSVCVVLRKVNDGIDMADLSKGLCLSAKARDIGRRSMQKQRVGAKPTESQHLDILCILAQRDSLLPSSNCARRLM